MDRASRRTIREDEFDHSEPITLDETLRVGSLIDGRYRLERHLGEGATGSVWRATHLQMRSPVALKILLPELRDREDAITRFWQEARLMGSVGHPNIVRVLDVSPARAPAPYMAMELLDGGSLYRRLKTGERLDAKEAGRLMDGVLSALRCAHSRGIVHRDLKPENLLFGSVRDLSTDTLRSELKILDFGASILLGRARRRGDSLWGTPYYMSPEQASNSELDHRSDLYSAAVVFYEMLTGGQLPHTGESVYAIIYNIATEPAIPIAKFRPDLPPTFHAFFERALARRPSDRFASAVAMRAALRRLTGYQADAHTWKSEAYPAASDEWARSADLSERRGHRPSRSGSHRSPRRARPPSTESTRTIRSATSETTLPERQAKTQTQDTTRCTHTHSRRWPLAVLVSLVPAFGVLQWRHDATTRVVQTLAIFLATWLISLAVLSLAHAVFRSQKRS